jgi:hypothetical protein
MINFSYPRFCLVLRRDLTEHRRTYIAFFCVLLIAHTLIHFLGNLIGFPDVRFAVQMFLNWGTFALASCYAMSLTYAHLNTKEHRISNFMLPASNFEKALSRHLLAIFGFWAIYLLSYLCSEIIQALYISVRLGVSEVANHSLIANILKITNNTWVHTNIDQLTPDVPWVLLSIHAFAASLFALGSAYFRNKAFIKVLLLTFVLNPMALFYPLNILENNGLHATWVDALYALCVLGLAGGVIYLAYRRYCRLQVL